MQDTDDLFSINDGDQVVSSQSTITRGILFTLLMGFILRHGLSQVATDDLLSIFNVVIPGCLPHSKYLFNKFARLSCEAQTHIYCGNCNAYIGQYNAACVTTVCTECNTTVDCGLMLKEGNFFLVSPLQDQLRNMFENCDVATAILEKQAQDSSRESTDYISDINCGSEYRRMKGCDDNLNRISVTFNTDGVPVFNSSSMTLWPVYHSINELPAKSRKQHMVLHCLWFGRVKPRMDTYLKPLVDEFRVLDDKGFTWKHKGELKTTKVNLGLCSCDSVARPLLQNFKQFNGSNGCSFCYHVGELKNVGPGNARVYPIVDNELLPTRRTNQNTVVDAEKAVFSGQPENGVKGPSILSLVTNFDIIQCFNPEYMHSVLLGVVRQWASLWFDSSSHKQPYYLGSHVREIDQCLLFIKAPSEIVRGPRPISMRKHWKATEWRSFLLFYSPIILHSFLLKRYYQHWLLLVFACYNLLQSCITKDLLLQSEQALMKFVYLVPSLYGRENVSFNCHLLTHLGTSVRQWGPLWAQSAFPFEDANGKLLKLFHGSRSICRQIFTSFHMMKNVHFFERRYLTSASERVCLLAKRISGSNLFSVCGQVISDGVIAQGLLKPEILSVSELLEVYKFLNIDLMPSNILSAQRLFHLGRVIHTSEYSAHVKSNDSLFTLKTRRGIFELRKCITFKRCTCLQANLQTDCLCLSEALCLLNVLTCKPVQAFDQDVGANVSSHIIQVRRTPQIEVCWPADICSKCILITNTSKEEFAIKLPVLFEN